MGKRKSSAPVAKKATPKLDTTFNCPFCNSNKSVHCVIDLDRELGEVYCNLCSNRYRNRITHLTEPIDLYHDWIDACEEANQEL